MAVQAAGDPWHWHELITAWAAVPHPQPHQSSPSAPAAAGARQRLRGSPARSLHRRGQHRGCTPTGAARPQRPASRQRAPRRRCGTAQRRPRIHTAARPRGPPARHLQRRESTAEQAGRHSVCRCTQMPACSSSSPARLASPARCPHSSSKPKHARAAAHRMLCPAIIRIHALPCISHHPPMPVYRPWNTLCTVPRRWGGEMRLTCTVPAAQARAKVRPCSSSQGSTNQGLGSSGSACSRRRQGGQRRRLAGQLGSRRQQPAAWLLLAGAAQPDLHPRTLTSGKMHMHVA